MDTLDTQPVADQPRFPTRKLWRKLLLVFPRLLVGLTLRLCLPCQQVPMAIVRALGQFDCWLEDLAEGDSRDDPQWQI